MKFSKRKIAIGSISLLLMMIIASGSYFMINRFKADEVVSDASVTNIAEVSQMTRVYELAASGNNIAWIGCNDPNKQYLCSITDYYRHTKLYVKNLITGEIKEFNNLTYPNRTAVSYFDNLELSGKDLYVTEDVNNAYEHSFININLDDFTITKLGSCTNFDACRNWRWRGYEVSNNKIAYQSGDYYHSNIFLGSKASPVGYKITGDSWPVVNWGPKIWGNYITYEHDNYGGDGTALRLYNADTKVSQKIEEYNGINGQLNIVDTWDTNDGKVVYEKRIDNVANTSSNIYDYQIVLYDIATKQKTVISELRVGDFESTGRTTPVLDLKISGQNIAWVNYAETAGSLFVYNISSKRTTKLSLGNDYIDELDLNGDRVTWSYKNKPNVYSGIISYTPQNSSPGSDPGTDIPDNNVPGGQDNTDQSGSDTTIPLKLPVITQQPLVKVVTNGVEACVTASSEKPLTYKWQKGDQDITLADVPNDQSCLRIGLDKLTLDYATKNITVTISNTDGSVKSDPVSLLQGDQIDFSDKFTTGWEMVSFGNANSNVCTKALSNNKLLAFSNNSYSVVTKFEAGKGYWMKVTDLEELGNLSCIALPYSSVVISAVKGWNMVGNPYQTNYDLGKLRFRYKDGSSKTFDEARQAKHILGYAWLYENQDKSYHFVTDDQNRYSNYKINYQKQNFINPFRGAMLYIKSDQISEIVMER